MNGKIIFCAALSVCMAVNLLAGESKIAMTVGTYNIRYLDGAEFDVPTKNEWARRAKHVAGIIGFEEPTVIGLQEVQKPQLDYLLSELPEYGYIGSGREDGKEGGEYSPIIYVKDKIDVVESGTFWLSETPDVPGSKGWDAMCKRVCSWGHFREKKSRKEFYFFNTHMDHMGTIARSEGAKLILSRMDKAIKSSISVFVTGDLNSDVDSEAYKAFMNAGFLKDSYLAAKRKFTPNGTVNWFLTDCVSNWRIDHLFVSKNVSVEKYAIMTNIYWEENDAVKSDEIGRKTLTPHMPSDHFPVFVKVGL